jgi:Sec63 Brl domain
MVDVISSSGWLNPALKAMEMSQMVTQVLSTYLGAVPSAGLLSSAVLSSVPSCAHCTFHPSLMPQCAHHLFPQVSDPHFVADPCGDAYMRAHN